MLNLPQQDAYDIAVTGCDKAVPLYGKLYNTSEKETGKDNFHDRNLGKTPYAFGRVHVAKSSVAKAERYCRLAAKCGYGPAKEFCDKYKIKY